MKTSTHRIKSSENPKYEYKENHTIAHYHSKAAKSQSKKKILKVAGGGTYLQMNNNNTDSAGFCLFVS